MKKRTKRKTKKNLEKSISKSSTGFGSIIGKMNIEFRKKMIVPKKEFLKKHTFGIKGTGSNSGGT